MVIVACDRALTGSYSIPGCFATHPSACHLASFSLSRHIAMFGIDNHLLCIIRIGVTCMIVSYPVHLSGLTPSQPALPSPCCVLSPSVRDNSSRPLSDHCWRVPTHPTALCDMHCRDIRDSVVTYSYPFSGLILLQPVPYRLRGTVQPKPPPGVLTKLPHALTYLTCPILPAPRPRRAHCAVPPRLITEHATAHRAHRSLCGWRRQGCCSDCCRALGRTGVAMQVM